MVCDEMGVRLGIGYRPSDISSGVEDAVGLGAKKTEDGRRDRRRDRRNNNKVRLSYYCMQLLPRTQSGRREGRRGEGEGGVLLIELVKTNR